MALTKIQSLGITDGTIVNADINASAAITLAKLSGVNDAKAWINFNGDGTVAINASFNVTSITDNGTGNYTVNFTTAFANTNYSFVFGGASANFFSNTYSTSSITIVSYNLTGTSLLDVTSICIAIFR
jgi:hypothetical protein